MIPSLRARLLRPILKRKFRSKSLTIAELRVRDLENIRLMGRLLNKARVDRIDIGGRDAVVLSGAEAREGKVLLYLHGGGYVCGAVDLYFGLCSSMVQAFRMRALLLEYRLAPEHPFPAALDDARKAWRWLLAEGYSAGDIVIAGDSAGGGLALALVLALREEGEALPGAILCLSPWTDLTNLSPSHRGRAKAELILQTEVLNEWAGLYAGEADLKDPLISPAKADFRGFPPLFIQVGSDEILLDDALIVAAKAKAAGVDVELRVWKGLWHVWQVLGDLLPESGEAIAEMAVFLQARKL